MSTNLKFEDGEIVECWRKQSHTSGWHLGTIVSSRVDERNRRSFRYSVDWQDKSIRSVNVAGELIRKVILDDFTSPEINTISEPSTLQHVEPHGITSVGFFSNVENRNIPYTLVSATPFLLYPYVEKVQRIR